MIENIELRVPEDFANRLFRPDEGKHLAEGNVRKVEIPGDDPRLLKISDLQKQIENEFGRAFFYGWEVRRSYSKDELESAALFHLQITSTFEPAGEECGTKYDESTACSHCGAGAKQTSRLFLDLKRIPKSKDICRTIAGEMLVSRRVAELFSRHGITGVELFPVQSNSARAAKSMDWFQLGVLNSTATIAKPTRVGIDPFDYDLDREYCCPLGDLIGLSLLSEVTIESASRGNADFISTRQFVGIRQGLLRPERLVLVSPRVWSIIASEKIKGCIVQVAHSS